MTSKICPECKRVVDYDPYFKAYYCRQCGWMEEVPERKVFKLHKPKTALQDSVKCAKLVLCK